MSAAVSGADFVIGLLAAKNDIAQARGLDKIVALTNLCLRHPVGGVRRRTSFRCKIPNGSGAVVHAVAFLFWAYLVACADRRIV